MVVWEAYGHRTRYASADGRWRGDWVGSVELSEVGTLLLGPAKATLQTFENARAAFSDFMYSELS